MKDMVMKNLADPIATDVTSLMNKKLLLSNYTPRVFVTNEGRHDFSKAEQYGKIVYITEGDVPVYSIDRLFFNIKEKLFDLTENDFILLSGSNIICSITMAAAICISPVIKLLIFKAKQEEYLIRKINLKDKVKWTQIPNQNT